MKWRPRTRKKIFGFCIFLPAFLEDILILLVRSCKLSSTSCEEPLESEELSTSEHCFELSSDPPIFDKAGGFALLGLGFQLLQTQSLRHVSPCSAPSSLNIIFAAPSYAPIATVSL